MLKNKKDIEEKKRRKNYLGIMLVTHARVPQNIAIFPAPAAPCVSTTQHRQGLPYPQY